MAGLIKGILAVVVALVPGGFLVLLGYAAARIVLHRHEVALAGAGGQPVTYLSALSGLTVRDVVKEARAAF